MKSHEVVFLKCVGLLICCCISLQFQLLASALFKSGSDFTALGKYAAVYPVALMFVWILFSCMEH